MWSPNLHISLELTHICKQVLSIMPKIPESPVRSQMKRSILAPSHRISTCPTSGGGPLDRLDGNLPFHCGRTVHCTASLHLLHVGYSEKEYKRNDKNHYYWLAWFNRKMLFHFPQVFPLISDWSVCYNGKHPTTAHGRLTFCPWVKNYS